MSERPLILVSNDDGVNAPGLQALHRALSKWADVVVVAPEREHSGTSHAITLERPLRHRELGPGVHAVDGTPADCVYLALNLGGFLPRPPALVLSGINHGLNLGMDVVYSGTVAAAREAAMRRVPAVAVSADARADMGHVAGAVQPLLERVLKARHPDGQVPLLNVNVPQPEVRGARATRLGRRDYIDMVEQREDPRGRSYYWIGGPVDHHERAQGTDTAAFDAGFISVTSLALDTSFADHLGVAAYAAGPEEEEEA